MPCVYDVNKDNEKVAMPELDPVTRSQNFCEVALGYTEEQAQEEARRCIQCPKKPCMSGCPVGVPIPQFIEQVALGNFAHAYQLVHQANTLPAVCGRACPQETQCEGKCTRGRKGEPVGIGRLERFVADWAMAHPDEVAAFEASATKSTSHTTAPCTADLADAQEASLESAFTAGSDDLDGYRVAVVGSGPASLTCAGELAQRGCDVSVFEALHETGGVLTYGIPEFRLPKKLVAEEIHKLEDVGVDFKTDVVVGKLYDIDELMDERGFDAVFVGTGAGLPSYLGIEGEGANGVMVANELLTRVNLMKAYQFPSFDTPVYAGKHCVVVGGGNVAMDAARTARRLGAEVTLVYRRGREQMPARAEEIHHAVQEGIKLQLLTNPVRVLVDDEGWIEGVECVSMELSEPDESGRQSVVAVPDSNFVIDADMMVVAVGSKTNPLIAKTTPGLEVTSRNLMVVDEQTCATSKPGVYAGGDAVSGAATVILAMGAGKRAAAGIADYLKVKQAS